MPNLSYIDIRAYRVIEMCDKIMNSIEDSRKRKLEEIIKNRMKKRVGWFWNRRNITREEAETDVYYNVKNDIWSDECFASISRGTQYDNCVRIKALAKLANNGNMFLTVDDLYWIT